MSITLNRYQAQTIVDFFGGEDSLVTVTECESGHSGPGLYVHSTEYPDDGSIFLGQEPDDGAEEDRRATEANNFVAPEN